MDRTILIVDHDEAERVKARCALLFEQYVVAEAAGANQALEMLSGGLTPGLVAVSVNGVREEARGFITELRRLPSHSKTPVLVIDSKLCEESQMHWKEAGATFCVMKPLTTGKLLETVRLLMF